MPLERWPFSTEPDPHERWVLGGYCPVVSETKAWCSRPLGHAGPHQSPRVPTPGVSIGPSNPAKVDWTR